MPKKAKVAIFEAKQPLFAPKNRAHIDITKDEFCDIYALGLGAKSGAVIAIRINDNKR